MSIMGSRHASTVARPKHPKAITKHRSRVRRELLIRNRREVNLSFHGIAFALTLRGWRRVAFGSHSSCSDGATGTDLVKGKQAAGRRGWRMGRLSPPSGGKRENGFWGTFTQGGDWPAARLGQSGPGLQICRAYGALGFGQPSPDCGGSAFGNP